MAALIVEDGTNVANANCFATVEQIRAYNDARGVKLPDSDDAVVSLAMNAMDYLRTYESKFAGDRTYGLMQRLSWPRRRVRAFGSEIDKNTIPLDIIDVVCYLAGVAQDIDLYGNQDTRAITKDVIGPIETDYSSTAGATNGPTLPTVTAMLRPYLVSGAGMIRSVRV